MALRSRVNTFTLGLKIIMEVMIKGMVYDYETYVLLFGGDNPPAEPFEWDPPVDPIKPPYKGGSK